MPKQIALTDEWIVLAKPAGWLTIPGRSEAPVLSEWVAREYGQTWTVHRIDRETSGLVLFARTAEAHRKANGWFQNHQVRKAYDCLAQGVASTPVFKMKSPVQGTSALTQAEVRERFEGAFLARALPVTGRRHQIRIHLAGAGHPLLGDVQYGGARSMRLRGAPGALAIERVALHAGRLELPSGEKFEAPWPEDFLSWVEALRASTRQ